jgi:electron transport complex protein RnfG
MSAHTHTLPVVTADGSPQPPPTQPPPPVASGRLIGLLAGGGAFAGLLIVLVFGWAQPRISAHQAQVLADAVGEVLGAPARTERLWIVDGRIVPDLPAGADSSRAERVWAGYDETGRRVGFAVLGAEAGFADVITLLFGYDPAQKRVLGMKVLDNKETPGLGDRIVKDTAFVGAFRGVGTPVAGVKPGAGKGAADEVDLITGATISSRTVVGIINHRIEAVGPLLERYTTEARP